MRFEIYSHEQIDSTNDEAKRLITSGSKDNFIIIAKEQTNGRGRDSRNWISKPGNLYMSLALRVHVPLDRQTNFCFIVGLSVGEAIKSLCKGQTSDILLKWPNDIMFNNQKVAGVLLESISFGRQDFLIIGIGVNITSNPSEKNKSSTNLQSENIKITSEKLLKLLVQNFEKYYLLWQDKGFEAIRELWLKYAYRLNKEIAFNYNGEIITGIFRDINLIGNIVLETKEGKLTNFSLGEIFF